MVVAYFASGVEKIEHRISIVAANVDVAEIPVAKQPCDDTVKTSEIILPFKAV